MEEKSVEPDLVGAITAADRMNSAAERDVVEKPKLLDVVKSLQDSDHRVGWAAM